MSRVVTLSGGSPWGITLEGGKDFGTQIKITKLTPGGKAMRGGVQQGDYILELNGQDTLPLTHHAAQQVIRNTGQSLVLKLSREQARRVTLIEPSPSPSPSPGSQSPSQGRPRPPPPPTSPGSQSPSQGRPRPPPPPTNTPTNTTPVSKKPAPPVAPSPQKVPVHQQPVVVKSAVSEEPVASDSILIPDSGLKTGSESTFQSPAFKKITMEQPSVLSPKSSYTPPPPVDQMKKVTIEDGNTYKSTARPPPPSKAPTTFTSTTMKIPSTTGPKTHSPMSKPSPPPSVKRPQPPPSPSTKVSSTPPPTTTTPTSAAKVSSRQGVCEACGQPIRGAYASAMNKVWHPEHFTCFRCHSQLSNTSFVYEDDKIFCSNCYETKVAETCFACRRPIVGGMVNAANRYYHSQCFRCTHCMVDLGTKEGFNMEDNHLYCQDCYGDMYGAVCHGCNRKINANVLWVEALDHTWHPECFVCGGCNRPLEGGRFFAKLGHPFCGDCC